VSDVLAQLKAIDVSGQLFIKDTHEAVLKILDQADYLNPKYQVVIANPPYMGGKGMNESLLKWTKDFYSDCWDKGVSDLYALFIERISKMTCDFGYMSMITMQGWMFASSYSTLREKLFENLSITSMVHLGARAFDSIPGQVVSTTAFVFFNNYERELKGSYLNLTEGSSEKDKKQILKNTIDSHSNTYIVDRSQFEKIPSCPVAYWITKKQSERYVKSELISTVASFKAGLSTGDNRRFQRIWHEVSRNNTKFGANESADIGNAKWIPCNSGGEYRKWYGNNEVVINWANNGSEIKGFKGSALRNESEYFQAGLTYNKISSGKFACRYKEDGFIFDDTGRSISTLEENLELVQGYLLSSVAHCYLNVLAPTLSFTSKELSNLPFMNKILFDKKVVLDLIRLSKNDWNTFEVSWDFSYSPLLKNVETFEIESAVNKYLALSMNNVNTMIQLEEKNNLVFANAFGLTGEISTEVSKYDITLSCNPYFTYGGVKTDSEIHCLHLNDIIKDFMSYTVGCMLGRYSLDQEGLILANQGDTLENYLKQVPNPSFTPDKDNVIPIINFDGDWFEDDISERFKTFLKVTFGKENFSENLAFVEEAIGKDIKKYFVKDFYADHVKRYKKRPIYWLFSSAKGTFNALIYMHRYQPDTVSVVLNDYLREFRTKLEARKSSYQQVEVSASASQSDKTQAIKAIGKIDKALIEVNEYEHEILYPLAGKPPEIDLDDGVKHNYPLFGKALKKVAGLS
ncbi:MAG: BREX-1 system adenine-specific DNA-methyltransferase PglX, partial [Endozoicomonadaceae bacterium]|nr:BREX-1 system adenine-specific DNA-methyltransferase PglX [Endozoicomonadaceae bacterium]